MRYTDEEKIALYRNKHDAYVISVEDVSSKNSLEIKKELIDLLEPSHDDAGLPVWVVFWRLDGMMNLPVLLEFRISDKNLIEDAILRVPEAKSGKLRKFTFDDFFKKKTSKVNRVSRDRSAPPPPEIDRNKLPFGMRKFANPFELHQITKFGREKLWTVYPTVRTDIDLAKSFEIYVDKYIEKYYPSVHRLDQYLDRDIRRAMTAMTDIEKLKKLPADVRAGLFKAMQDGRLLDIKKACEEIISAIRSQPLDELAILDR
jgi:hypothetical protein